jgi:hypothetical protein
VPNWDAHLKGGLIVEADNNRSRLNYIEEIKMKKVMLTILILTLAAVSQAELLSDPGFEEGAWADSYSAAYYSYYWYYGGTIEAVTDPALARSGNNYLVSGNYMYGGNWGYSVSWQDLPAVEGAVIYPFGMVHG